MKAAQLLEHASATLRDAGVESPRLDAQLLLAYVLAEPRSPLLGDRELAEDAVARFDQLIMRRARREPLQYLTGEAPFRYSMLAVGEGVFIPRPETELLVDAVLPWLSDLSAPVVVDLCAGSGALAVAIAREVPRVTVIAVERSSDALSWLRRNTADTTIEVVAADIAAAGILSHLNGKVDIVVSNPPYVPIDATVQAEVLWDPAEAVFAGPDGLSVLPTVVTLADRLLRPGGFLSVEHDESHGDAVIALLDSSRWADVTDRPDLTCRLRYATAVHL